MLLLAGDYGFECHDARDALIGKTRAIDRMDASLPIYCRLSSDDLTIIAMGKSLAAKARRCLMANRLLLKP